MNKNKLQEMRQKVLENHDELSPNEILGAVKQSLTQNIEVLDKFLRLETGRTISAQEIDEIFTPDINNKYGAENTPIMNDFGLLSTNFIPLGIVFVDVNYSLPIENYLQLLKVLIETKNSIIIKPHQEFRTLEAFVTIINDVLTRLPATNGIEVVNHDVYNLDIDAVVYVGEKREFNKLDGKFQKIHVGVGRYELYVDEEIDKKLIEDAKSKNVQIFYPQENVFDLINQEGGNYATAIMSSNPDKIKEFMRDVKSSFKFVNISPMNIKRVNLFPEQLLKRQTMVVYK